MSALKLAPDIQEAVLFPARVERGRELVKMRQLLAVVTIHEWQRQRTVLQTLKLTTS
jgi:hypothetical protein